VFAELRPMSVNKVAVQFKTFKIFGLIPITAPESAKGAVMRGGKLSQPTHAHMCQLQFYRLLPLAGACTSNAEFTVDSRVRVQWKEAVLRVQRKCSLLRRRHDVHCTGREHGRLKSETLPPSTRVRTLAAGHTAAIMCAEKPWWAVPQPCC
jgi:hypothetical protein